MTGKTYKTAVVIIPPLEIWPSIQAIRQKHDRHFRRWMPHITLLYPFLPRSLFPSVAEQLACVCARLQPFQIELAQFRFFHHGRSGYTLWLAPEPHETLAELQTTLWQVVPKCDDVRRYGRGFTPHLSVGQARKENTMKQLLLELQGAWRSICFSMSAISLIWRNDPPDDVFRVEHTIELGSSLSSGTV